MISCLIFVLLLSSFAYGKDHYINTVTDSDDVAIGNAGEIFVDNSISAIGIGAVPQAGNKLYVVNNVGPAIYVKSTASLPTYPIYAHTTTPNTYGVWGYSSSHTGGYFTSNGETVSTISSSGTALKASSNIGDAAIFNGGRLIFNGINPVSALSIGNSGPLNAGIFGEGVSYGIYGKTTGKTGDYGVYADGGSMGSGAWGTSTNSYGAVGNGTIGLKGDNFGSSTRYGLAGTANYGVYGQYNTNIYGYLGGSYYGLAGVSTGTGLYAYGSDRAADINGDIIMSEGSFIEVQNGDKNIQLSDKDPTWYGDNYGSVTTIRGDGSLSSGLLKTGGMNLSRHAVAETVMGKWFLNSSDNQNGAGAYWDWDNEVINTNTNVFSWTPGADTLTLNGASYPGFYEICWSLTYYLVGEGNYIYTNLRIGGTTEYSTYTGGLQYSYHTISGCAIHEFTSSETVGFYAYSNDGSYYHFGSTSNNNGRYSWWSIKRLN